MPKENIARLPEASNKCPARKFTPLSHVDWGVLQGREQRTVPCTIIYINLNIYIKKKLQFDIYLWYIMTR